MNKLIVASSLVVLGALTACSPTRTPEQYRSETASAIATKDAQLQSCFTDARKTEPDAKGTVAVEFTWSSLAGENVRVPSDVKVIDAKSTAPNSLKECAVKVVKAASLKPKGSGVGKAAWTFTFEAPPASPPTATAAPTEPAKS